MQTGRKLEMTIDFFARKEYDKDYEDTTGSAADILMGTDCFIYKIPIDWTADFGRKDHTEKVGDIMRGRYIHASIGVRRGNSHNGFTPFPEPVLVIGFSIILEFFGEWELAFEEELQKYLKDVVEEGQNLYWIYRDRMEEKNEGE